MLVNKILEIQRSINYKIRKSIFEHGAIDLEALCLTKPLSKDKFQRGISKSLKSSQKASLGNVLPARYKKMLKKLEQMEGKDGYNRFDEWFLNKISKNKEYIKKAYKLAIMTDYFENPRFDQYDIDNLITLSHKQFNRIPILAKIANAEKKPLYDGCGIGKMCTIEDKKFPMALKIAKKTNSLDEPLFTVQTICELVDMPNKKIKKAIWLAKIPDLENRPLFFNENMIFKMLELSDKQLKRIPYLKKFRNEFYQQRFDYYDIYELCKIPDEQFKRAPKLIKMKSEDTPRFNVSDIIELCSLTDKQFKNFDKLAAIQELSNNDIIVLLESDMEYLSQLPFCERKNKLAILENMYIRFKDNKNLIETLELDKIKQRIKASISSATSPISVSGEAKTKFFKQAIALNNFETLKTIQGMDKIISRYGKEGLPLQYKRQNFVKDLSSVLKDLPESQRTEILSKLEIKFTQDSRGYNGLLNLSKLDIKNPVEKRVKELCERFLLKNYIQTGNKDVDKVLNSLIQGFPEFVNIIGKKHHGIHQYTIDTHTMKVLQSALSDAKFGSLSNLDKMCLQLVIILHDLGKKEGVIDKGHEFLSAIYAQDILKKINLPVSVKDRIVEIIKNHNWWEQLNTSQISEKEVATIFRRPEDLTIAEIFAKADLKGVSDKFYQSHIGNFEEKMLKCKKFQEIFYEGGNMLFPTRIINSAKIPRQIFDGHEYKVVDFTQIPPNADLFDYGLSIHKKSDFKALFHYGDLETVNELNNPVNEGTISTTLISPTKKLTYCNSKIGMMLETDNINIINSSYQNQNSGNKRGFYSFIEYTLGGIYWWERHLQRNTFLKFLAKKYNLSEEQYGKLYKQLQEKRFLTQIKDIIIDDKLIKKGDIINAYKKIEEEIIKYTARDNNEVIVYNPKIKGIIAKVKSISDIQEEILKFVRENDLPIFIMGE